MSDIVSDLQSFNEEKLNSEPYTCEEIAKAAADEITRLREENARLRLLVKTAYAEGCYDSTKTEKTQEEFEALWQESFARAAIREGEGKCR